MKKMVIAAVLAAAIPGAADAAVTVLYRNDFNLGTDYMAQALADPLYTVTTTSGNLSSFTLSNYQVIVYANQNSGVPSGDVGRLDAFIAAGGRVIYQDWLQVSPPTLNSSYTGGSNQTAVNVGAQLGGGSLTLTNPGWGTFSTGLNALAGGTVQATFGNGSAAIVSGNGGRTFHNGFLTDTVGTSRIYTAQLSSFFAGGAVPEPATWLMLIMGFGFVGAAIRRRPAQNVRVNYKFA
jgi:PEP-CTERM motif